MTDTVLIIDFGSQVTQLIARRVREAGVYSEIAPFNKAEEAFARLKPKAVIFSGSPASVLDKDAPLPPRSVYTAGVPILGICYGEQAMAHQLGGKVEGEHNREFGRAFIEVVQQAALFDGVWKPGERHQVWMSHGDRVTKLPTGFEVVGTSDGAPFAAIADEKRKFYAIQFHPEVVHTPDGAKLLSNFVHKVAGLKGDWTMAAFRAQAIDRIRQQVGKGRVICGLSGGVDSSVAALLLHEAIGDQLTCVFVDHGLMREGEADGGRVALPRPLQHSAGARRRERHVSRRARWRQRPRGEAEDDRPAVHRRVRRGGAEGRRRRFPGAGHALPGRDRERLGAWRPFGHDQVAPQCRRLAGSHAHEGGRAAAGTVQGRGEGARPRARPTRGLRRPASVPGPGLAIRVPGAITREKLAILRRADAIYLDEIRKAGLYDAIWQAFAVLLPVRTVGVMGDGRTYDFVCALRAVTSNDGMTADFFPFDMAFLGRAATRIINEVKGINRVVYDVTSKPPGTIEWEWLSLSNSLIRSAFNLRTT